MNKIKNIFLLIVISLCVSSVYAQKETLTFKISKPKSEIHLRTIDSVFHSDNVNPMVVEMTGKNKVFRVTVLDGKVTRRPNNYFEIRFDGPGETMVKVYEKTPEGKVQLGLTQAFKIVPPPQPTVYVCGVKGDSVIDKKHLINVGELSAQLENSRIMPAILSFDLVLPTGEINDTLHIQGAKFPITVKNKLYDLDEGQVVTFLNIKVLMPNRSVATIEELIVFIAKTDQYSVGHRNETLKIEGE